MDLLQAYRQAIKRRDLIEDQLQIEAIGLLQRLAIDIADVLQVQHLLQVQRADDVVELVLVDGQPRVIGGGELLDQVEAWWRDKDYRPDRDACLAELELRIQQSEPIVLPPPSRDPHEEP